MHNQICCRQTTKIIIIIKCYKTLCFIIIHTHLSLFHLVVMSGPSQAWLGRLQIFFAVVFFLLRSNKHHIYASHFFWQFLIACTRLSTHLQKHRRLLIVKYCKLHESCYCAVGQLHSQYKSLGTYGKRCCIFCIKRPNILSTTFFRVRQVSS